MTYLNLVPTSSQNPGTYVPEQGTNPTSSPRPPLLQKGDVGTRSVRPKSWDERKPETTPCGEKEELAA